MKKWLGFIAILTALLIPMPVKAIGVSPYIANINVLASSYAELVFTITGCSSVDLSLEGIPLTVEPSHTSVMDGKITAKILGSLSVPTGAYTGYLVIMESGQQVGAGVKVSLTVNHINSQSVMLTTIVLSSDGGWHSWGGSSGGYYVPPVVTPPVVTPPVVTPPVVTPPIYTPPPSEAPPSIPPAVGEPMPTKQGAVNWGAVLLISIAVLVVGFAVWHLWEIVR
jgi:hypothetical protein